MRLRFLPVVSAMLVVGTLGFAQATHALSLVPPTLEFSTQAGQTVTGKIKLYNDEKDYKTYYVSTANFTAGDENGQPKFDFTTTPTDLADWISIDASQINIQPSASGVVNVTVAVPKNADPGGHYAGVFFSATPPDAGNVKVQQKTGTLIILRVEGSIREAATVAQFGSAAGKSVSSSLPVSLLLRVRNSGNVHLRPKGTVTVRNMFGGVTATLDLNPNQGAVLPNSVRRFTLIWDKDAATAKKGGFFRQIANEWNNFALGSYTAELAATYGSSNQTLSATYRMTIFPWQLLLVILIALVLLVLLVVWVISRYNASIIRHAGLRASSTSNSKRPPLG